MISVSTAQMRELECRATEEFGISSLTLMENAGRSAAEFILKRFPAAGSILVICGKGNNGGDGFVIARCLYTQKRGVEIVLLANPEDLKGDAQTNFDWAVDLRIPVGFDMPMEKPDLIVDAILGTGLKKDVRDAYRSAIEWVNASGAPVVAVDIPSGLNGDTGEVMGISVKADYTLSMGFAKKGLLAGSGPEYCGELHIIDIGLPEALCPSVLDTP